MAAQVDLNTGAIPLCRSSSRSGRSARVRTGESEAKKAALTLLVAAFGAVSSHWRFRGVFMSTLASPVGCCAANHNEGLWYESQTTLALFYSGSLRGSFLLGKKRRDSIQPAVEQQRIGVGPHPLNDRVLWFRGPL
jgi:hypothetical protein